MSNLYESLKPAALWKHFAAMNAIPRPSKHEDKIQQFAKQFGEKLGLKTIKDDIGNIIICKPATPGMENRMGVILQGHLDMVPQKNSDTNHDFLKDPIKTYIEDGWVKAKGTTLGADNAIGIAAGMAILESKNIPHGPIEVLMTTDEETGMTGAEGLKSDILKGDILINMDSEDEGELYIGCAGGIDTIANFSCQEESVPSNVVAFKLCLTGLKGGHSGLDIHLGRGNANILLVRLMLQASEKFGMRMSEINAGSLRNAIPREAFANIVIPQNNTEKFKSFVQEYFKKIKDDLKDTDAGVDIKILPVDLPQYLIDSETQLKLFTAVNNCPNGVIAMSKDMPGVVETSSNLAVIKSVNGKIEIGTLQRSAIDADRDKIASTIFKVFDEAGADTRNIGAYPGWKPDVNSAILKTMKDVYHTMYGKIPEVKVIHAGLECGILGAKYPHWDMVSFGPTIRNPHSPDEMVNIKSVGKFWDYLVETLKNIPKK